MIDDLKEKVKTRDKNGEVITISDEYISSLDLERDEEDYYLDAHGSRIHFKNIPELKAPNTKINISNEQLIELYKCSEDYEYFYKNYVRVLTKKGYARAENRSYQNRLSECLTGQEGKRLLVMGSRQSGKCCVGDTAITIRNKITGEIVEMSMEEFHELSRTQDKD